MNKLTERTLLNKPSLPISPENSFETKKSLRRKRYSHHQKANNPIDASILLNNQDTFSSILARKRSLNNHSDLQSYKNLVDSVQPVRVPEHLSKLGGSPSY
jgi:hypothetical protein